MSKVLSIVLVAALAAPQLHAQQLPRLLTDGTAVGGSAGAFLADGGAIYTVGLSISTLRAGRVSSDVTVSLPPELLAYGLVILATDVAAAYNVALPGVTILLKAGPSLVAGGGSGGGAAYFGALAGVALIVRAGPGAAFRIDLVERVYQTGLHTYPMSSISFGIAALPRAP